MLAGNLAAIGVGGIISTVWSYIVSIPAVISPLSSFWYLDQSPDDFDFDVTRAINSPHYDLKNVLDSPTDAKAPSDTDSKNEKEPKETVAPAHDHVTVRAGVTDEKDLDPVALNKAFKFAAWASLALVRSNLLTQNLMLIDASLV
jgi:urea-proton symporter